MGAHGRTTQSFCQLGLSTPCLKIGKRLFLFFLARGTLVLVHPSVLCSAHLCNVSDSNFCACSCKLESCMDLWSWCSGKYLTPWLPQPPPGHRPCPLLARVSPAILADLNVNITAGAGDAPCDSSWGPALKPPAMLHSSCLLHPFSSIARWLMRSEDGRDSLELHEPLVFAGCVCGLCGTDGCQS